MPDNIYNCAKASLGEHITLDASIPNDVGCCEAVSYILEKAGIPVPRVGIPGTWTLYQWLQASPLFKEVSAPEQGAVIISPGGHCGICLIYGIGSNNSSTGIFAENYSYQGWLHQFNDIEKLSTHYFVAL